MKFKNILQIATMIVLCTLFCYLISCKSIPQKELSQNTQYQENTSFEETSDIASIIIVKVPLRKLITSNEKTLSNYLESMCEDDTNHIKAEIKNQYPEYELNSNYTIENKEILSITNSTCFLFVTIKTY